MCPFHFFLAILQRTETRTFLRKLVVLSSVLRQSYFWFWKVCFRVGEPKLLLTVVPCRCRAAEEEERGGDVLASTWCDCELSQSLSPSGRRPQTGTVSTNCCQARSSSSLPPWPSLCQKSWRRDVSSRRPSPAPSAAPGRRWRWMSTAPTPHRPSPSTTSTRDASSRHTSTCE